MTRLPVDVVIPAFNAEATIERAIRSARLVHPAAVRVVDDGSTDSTARVARTAGAIVHSQKNSGALSARFAGLNAGDAPLVILLDADDALLEGMTQLVEVLSRSASTVAAVMGCTVAVSREGATRRIRLWEEGVTAQSLIDRAGAPGPPAAFVWRRNELLQTLASEDIASTPLAEDYDLLIRFAERFAIKQVPVDACLYSLAGGKSARNVLQSIQVTEGIRQRRASEFGLNISPRSPAQMAAVADLRRAFDAPGRSQAVRRVGLYARALLRDPRLIRRIGVSIVNRLFRSRKRVPS
jgi:glycosyltransferase involved in cell wall biosynthesis